MGPTDEAERLSDRREAILQAVVEEYMATARPVGSGLVADQSKLAVSSATIRKELSALEDEGFLHQPHTSAGRVPTDKGYRYFIDALMSPSTLNANQNQRIQEFFAKTHGELERILTETSRLLAGVTGSAAVVVAPSAEAASIRSVQLVGLGPRTVLMVAVLSTGGIERRTFELTVDMSDVQLASAEARVADVLIGARPGGAVDAPRPTNDSVVDELALAAAASLGSDETPRVHVGGRSTVATVFDEVDQVREVLQLFERQLLVVTLLRDVLDRGLRVAIGSETGMQNLNDCALVVAPYAVDGTEAGSIGVIGPTHMNYPQALAAVAVVSNELGERLTRG